MVAIPQYESKVGVSHTPTSYYRTSVNPDAFGAGIARATEKLGESSEFFIRSIQGKIFILIPREQSCFPFQLGSRNT